jgi:hypothetical protein
VNLSWSRCAVPMPFRAGTRGKAASETFLDN